MNEEDKYVDNFQMVEIKTMFYSFICRNENRINI